MFDTRDTAHEAQGLAMREASILARSVGQPVECRVYRMGAPERDTFGRDVSPAFYLGRAVGTPAGVEWQEGIAKRRAAA
ncbi:MAG: hypothetical protein COW54_08640 [Rhodobacteraceae bacterium CG17_big_fil_post_rev_8_21_14_2_50_63_15]|nr:MAG: hypothetical protein COW54_08640 [Rhodobacteraceae bacterium CG17_big_fil_post_rev_8_21_14_2_50_63_15]